MVHPDHPVDHDEGDGDGGAEVVRDASGPGQLLLVALPRLPLLPVHRAFAALLTFPTHCS